MFPIQHQRIAAVGGNMLLRLALLMLIAWLPGVVGLYNVWTLVHVFPW